MNSSWEESVLEKLKSELWVSEGITKEKVEDILSKLKNEVWSSTSKGELTEKRKKWTDQVLSKLKNDLWIALDEDGGYTREKVASILSRLKEDLWD